MIYEQIDETIQQRINCVFGTLALEGISLSDRSIENIKRYASKEVSYEELLDEIKNRYLHKTK